MPKELPPPLPPAERTVGQLVAESMRLYGRRFWPSLALGVPIALLDELSWGRSTDAQTLLLWAWTPLLVASMIGAVAIAGDIRRDRLPLAFAVGVLVFAPVPLLLRLYLLPALAWLALFGLAVPAVLYEGASFRDALIRGRRLASADYVHAFGSLCALAIVTGLSQGMLFLLLHGQADAELRVAGFLAALVVSPLIFLGTALLYFDQAARVVDSKPREKRRSPDAGLHPAVDAHRAGRADAEVES
jgi:hypothetical protein